MCHRVLDPWSIKSVRHTNPQVQWRFFGTNTSIINQYTYPAYDKAWCELKPVRKASTPTSWVSRFTRFQPPFLVYISITIYSFHWDNPILMRIFIEIYSNNDKGNSLKNISPISDVFLHTSFIEFDGPYNFGPPQGPSYGFSNIGSYVDVSLPDFHGSGTDQFISSFWLAFLIVFFFHISDTAQMECFFIPVSFKVWM